MSSLDLHPDELLDKAAQGSLSADEAVRLEAHLALCTVCRFEQQVKKDFAAEAMSLPALDVDSLITRALAGHASNDAADDTAQRVRPRSRSAAPYVVAAVMLSTMASFAAVARYTDVWPAAKAVLATLLPGEPVSVTPKSESRGAPKQVPVSAREEVPPELPVIDEPVALVVDPVVAPVVEAPKVRAAPRVVSAVEVTRELPPPPPMIEAPVETAAELFSRANQARVRGDRGTAIAGYSDLLTRFPHAAEAQLSEAIVGRLLLDDGDAGAALTHFDSYLQTSETGLREEAIEARARALRVLGRNDEEAQAWQQLLNTYPQSIYKERAESRLNALSNH